MTTYFILAGGFVKIGKTSNVAKRIRNIQTANASQVELIKVSTISEVDAHKEAKKRSGRANGEWFRATEMLLSWIKSLPSDPSYEHEHSGGCNFWEMTPTEFEKAIKDFNFPEKLKAYRKRLRLSQAAAAEFLDVSPRTIWLWESGAKVHLVAQEGVIARFAKNPTPTKP